MSSDILKYAVFDDRIVQQKPAFQVTKGALSVTNSPFNAIAANSSQHTYNILVPSENIFIDRALDWTSTCALTFQVSLTAPAGAAIAAGTPIFVPGRDFALAAFPLQQLTTTMTATINDTTVTINSADVLNQVLRMTDYKKNRLIRTCPTMLDRYQNYNESYLSGNTPLNGYEQALNVDEVPNGAFPGFAFTNASNTPLSLVQGGPVVYGSSPADWTWVAGNNIPVVNTPVAAGTTVTYQLYAQFTSTEKLVLSPFVFADCYEWDTGLFGCQNIQLIMNLQAPSRVLRSTSGAGATLVPGSVVYNSQIPTPFPAARVNLQFLTPSLDISLPPKSVVPYMEFPRFISSNFQSLAAGASVTLASQTITLPQIPDLLMIYCRPQAYTVSGTQNADPTQADWLLPISNISVNFDNFAGLLSAHTQQQLYKMSVHNGLEMDWAQWSGFGVVNKNGTANPQQPLVGGMLVLKPGRDIVLQAGQASSLVGNFVLQFNLTVTNQSANAVTPVIYVITANSGFFETIKGSSRVIKGVLTEQDIISAPLAPMGTHGSLARAVGAGMSGMANSLGAAMKNVMSMGSAKGKQEMPGNREDMSSNGGRGKKSVLPGMSNKSAMDSYF
jgi:hypothetical protein